MKNKLRLILIVTTILACKVTGQATNENINDYTKFVNPMIGTDWNGHTFPGATVPFGMVQLSPDGGTKGWDWCSGYHQSDSSLLGFSHTHLSGTGVSDYGDILIMPITGKTHG